MEARSAHVVLNSMGRRFVCCSKVHQVETCRVVVVVVVELKKQIHDVAEENQTEDDENDDD